MKSMQRQQLPQHRAFSSCRPQIQHTRPYCPPARSTAVDHLVMTVDGFNPSKATAVYPELRQLDQQSVEQALTVVQGILPQRILGTTLTQHPQLLSTDMTAWVDFLTAFGFDESRIQELLRSCPEVFYKSNVFQAGQLLLFLRQHLQLPDEAVLKHFKWAAVLSPSATQQSMVGVTHALTQHLMAAVDATSSGTSSTSSTTTTTTTTSSSSGGDAPSTPPQTPAELLPLLETFPEVLGWDVGRDLLPKLAFFEGLGPQGRALLSGSLWDAGSSWLPGLRSWGYSVAPKLDLLADVLGSAEEAAALVQQCPTVLKLPVETKLQPVLTALTTLGLDGQQVAQLLRSCPKLLAESKDSIVSRVNFLTDAIDGTAEDLLLYPGYVLLSLSDVVGPRYYYLARHPGWLDSFSDAGSGSLDLRRVMQPSLDNFLQDVAQVTGVSRREVDSDYAELSAEWDNLLGWCCDKAFSSLDQVNTMYREQINLFYVLVQ